MPDEDNKVKKFPIDQLGIKEEALWSCKACGHEITDSMEKSNAEKSKVLPINMGGVMIYICPIGLVIFFDVKIPKPNSSI